MAIATSRDIRRLQDAINSTGMATTLLINTSELLLAEMRKVDEHNVSDTAHMDLRDLIRILLPNWDDEGRYTGPVAVKKNDDIILGIEFLDEEDMEQWAMEENDSGSHDV